MKPGTFTQFYIQLVFSPLHREFLLNSEIRPQIFSCMSGILTHLKHKSIIINGVEDHAHLFLGLHPDISVSDTVRDRKRGSSVFINQNKYFRGKFEWQSGYGGFSYSHSQVGKVYNYILNQESHHKKRSFKEEYLDFLNRYEIEFEGQYLFEFFNNETATRHLPICILLQ